MSIALSIYCVVCMISSIFALKQQKTMLIPFLPKVALFFASPILAPWVALAWVLEKLFRKLDNRPVDTDTVLQSSAFILMFVLIHAIFIVNMPDNAHAQKGTDNVSHCTQQ